MTLTIKKLERLDVIRPAGCTDLAVAKHRGKRLLCTFGANATAEHAAKFESLTWVTMDGRHFEQVIDSASL